LSDWDFYRKTVVFGQITIREKCPRRTQHCTPITNGQLKATNDQ
jgi:hypothetical protein